MALLHTGDRICASCGGMNGKHRPGCIGDDNVEVISVYGRQQAVEDGILVDCEQAPMGGAGGGRGHYAVDQRSDRGAVPGADTKAVRKWRSAVRGSSIRIGKFVLQEYFQIPLSNVSCFTVIHIWREYSTELECLCGDSDC